MIIDFHTHIVHDAVRNNRAAYFEGEPGFKLLYESPKSKLAGAADTIAAMDQDGVDRSVVFGFPWRNADTIKENNDYVIAVAQKHPDRLIGFCCVDPAHESAPREVERCLDAGCSGVGELAFYGTGIDEKALSLLDPIMALCRDRDKVVLIHTNEPVGHMYPGKSPITLLQIFNLARRYKENKIVLAHWGGGIFFYHLMKKEVKESLQHIWYDTAASPFLYDHQIYQYAKSLAGLDKIVFGTDYPLLGAKRYFGEMEKAGLTPDEMNVICGKNAENLLGL